MKGSTSKQENGVSSISTPKSIYPPDKDKDVATLQKNEKLKKQIHDKLRSKESASLPELPRSPTVYRERSVDVDYQIQEVAEEFQETRISVVEFREDTNDEVFYAKVENSEVVSSKEVLAQFQDIQTEVVYAKSKKSKVSFHVEQTQLSNIEFREENVENTKVEFHEENEDIFKKVGEKAKKKIRNETVLQLDIENGEVTSNDFDQQEETVKFQEINEIEKSDYYQPYIEVQVENEFGEIVPTSPKSIERRYQESVKNLQELQTEMPPPTPMRRKSRESSFNESPQNGQPPSVKPRMKRMNRSSSDASNSSKGEEKNDEVEKKNIDKVEEEIDEKILQNIILEIIPAQEVIEKSETIVLQNGFIENLPQENLEEEFKENVPETKQRKLPEPIEIVIIKNEPQQIEVKSLPKSILKSSETSSSSKTISFINEPETISDSSTDCSESEEEDVWAKIEEDRFYLNRLNKNNYPDVPPPLPKTPPPPLEDEDKREFSFA